MKEWRISALRLVLIILGVQCGVFLDSQSVTLLGWRHLWKSQPLWLEGRACFRAHIEWFDFLLILYTVLLFFFFANTLLIVLFFELLGMLLKCALRRLINWLLRTRDSRHRRPHLERRVSIELHLVLLVDIDQLVLIMSTVWTSDDVARVFFCFFCEVADAESADIVLTASWNKNSVEVSEADRATVLVDGLLALVGREVIYIQHVALGHLCLYTDLVPRSHISYCNCLGNLSVLLHGVTSLLPSHIMPLVGVAVRVKTIVVLVVVWARVSIMIPLVQEALSRVRRRWIVSKGACHAWTVATIVADVWHTRRVVVKTTDTSRRSTWAIPVKSIGMLLIVHAPSAPVSVVRRAVVSEDLVQT